jgi:polyhydroxyalkanoate synthesis regulator phasin
MPKKRNEETQAQQAERFKQAVQELVDAGELNSTEADAAFDKAMSGVAKLRQAWVDGPEDLENR